MKTDTTKIKVRIMIAVDQDGNWIALGGSDYQNDKVLRENIFIDALKDGEQFRFVEAEIPGHDEPTVQGEAKL